MMRSTKFVSIIATALAVGMIIVVGGCGNDGQNGSADADGGNKQSCICSKGNPDACPVHGKKVGGGNTAVTTGGAGGAKLTKVDIKLPRAMFKGTPVPMNEPNIAKPRGKPRPPFEAPEGTTNLALKKPVISNERLPVVGDLDMVTDGDKSGEDGHNVDIGFGKKWVQIDLEKKADIYAILVWHYHGQARAYRDVIVEVADDSDFTENVQIVFNSDHDNTYGKGIGDKYGYVETNEGRLMRCPKGTKGRFVRLHSYGNTSNDHNHYVEVEVYGIQVK